MSKMSNTIDPQMKSWVEIPQYSDFPIQNIPFGIFKTDTLGARVGVAIGNHVLDLAILHQEGFLEGFNLPERVFFQPFLNDFMALGKDITTAVRDRIAEILEEHNPELRDQADMKAHVLFHQDEVQMQMPVQVMNYTDFYSSEQHARNVGTMFRDPQNALLPNWKHLPVGYHGRASSILVSGTPFHRPKGQTKADDADTPSFGPSRLLDFELEMAFVTCRENQLGESVSTSEADDYVFGFVLFNDWSARDLQKWEYVPLGPFLAKSFASHISPWVVTLEALEPFCIPGPKQSPEVLPYLKYEGKAHFDVQLEVGLQPENQQETIISKSNFKHMYWNYRQQLAHQSVNGCNLKVGDMYASGTISGPEPSSYGSMLELSWRGTQPIKLNGAEERKFVQDQDTVIMRGYAEKHGVRVGFGEVKAQVLPAKQ